MNYIFDLSTEETGFYDTTISLQDSNLINIDLEIFDEIDEPRLISYQQDYKGLIRASLLPETKDIRLEPVNNDSLIHYIEYQKDSLYIWHNDLASDSSLFLLHYDDKTDTLINKRARNKLSDKALTLHSSLKKDLSVHARDTIRVPFNRPLLKIDSIQLSLKDSALYLDVEFLSQDFRELLFTSQSIKHNSEYDLRFFPGSVEDIYGVKNQDTLSLQLKTVDPDQLGTISMNYQNETDTTYLIQFKRGNEILSESVVDSSLSVKFNKLQKGSYTLSLVEDLNGDGKWTGGSVLYKRKPEMIKELNLEELKPGWDLELDIKIKEIFYGTPVE